MTDGASHEKSNVDDLIEGSVAALLGGGIEVAVGGGAGVLLGGVGSVLIANLIRRANERELRNANRVLALTAEDLGLDLGELADRLYADVRAELLADNAIRASVLTAMDTKIDALAKALAFGLEDDAHLDLSDLIIRAMNDLEAPHVRVLSWFAQGIGIRRPNGPDYENWDHRTWGCKVAGVAEVREAFPDFHIGIDGIVAILESHGLVALASEDLGRELDARRSYSNLRGLGGRQSVSYSGLRLKRQWKIAPLGAEVLHYITPAPTNAGSD